MDRAGGAGGLGGVLVRLSTRPARAGSGFVATITLAMVVAALLQVVFGALGPFLVRDLGLSRSQLGALTTTLYVTGAFLSPAAGRLVDAFGGRPPLAGLFAVKAVGLATVAWAPSYPWLLIGALIGGLAVALGNPVTNLLIQDHVRPPRQGLVTGIKQSGVQLGVFVGSAALPFIAQANGWRVAAAVCLAAPVLGLLGTAALTPHSPPSPRPGDGVVRPPLPPGTAWLTTYALGMGVGIASIGAYLPLYGVERLGLGEGVAGLLTAVVGGVGVVARIAWGHAADRSDTPPQRVLVVLAALALAATVAIALASEPLLWVVWLGAVLAGAGAAAWNSVGMLAIIRGAPRAVAGRASGIVLLSFYGGFVVGPIAFGALVDAADRYEPGWLLVLTAFAVSTAVAWTWTRRAPGAA